MVRVGRAAVLLGGALALFAPRAEAAGWREVRETGGDARLEVRADGVATVLHRVRYRIVAGRYESFDFAGVDPRSVPAPEAAITRPGVDGELIARVEPVADTPGTLRLHIDEPRGLGRGVYHVELRYELDLVAAQLLTRDGAMWKLAWTAPPSRAGHDGSRVVFDLPAAPVAPRVADPSEAATTLATVRRSAVRDEIELVRAHVPRGHAATWSVRVDPTAFPEVSSPELRSPAVAPPAEERAGWPVERLVGGALLLALAGALAALLRAKQRAVEGAASRRGARARPLVALPWGLGPLLYGAATASALALMLWGDPTLGAALVVGAMALATHRAPVALARTRGPGTWRALSSSSALVAPPAPPDALDVTTARGRLAFAAAACALVAAAWALGSWIPEGTVALPLAAAALAPIFVTGTRRSLPPTPTEQAASVLRPARDALAAEIDLSHVDVQAIGRVLAAASSCAPDAGDLARGEIDEIRLACAPRDRAVGLRAVEIAATTSPLGHALPEVFVRFDDGSAAGGRVAGIAAGAPAVLGRTPEEKVVRLAPAEPTPTAAAALVARLLLALEGRRAIDRGEPPTLRWEGMDRRRARASAGTPHVVPLC